MGPIPNGYKLWMFNCRKRPRVNRASPLALRDFAPGGRGTAAGGGIFDNQFEAPVSVHRRQFHDVKLHLYFKFIGYYAYLLSCSIYFNSAAVMEVYSYTSIHPLGHTGPVTYHFTLFFFLLIRTLYSKFQAAITK
jgi:hypothetical protein